MTDLAHHEIRLGELFSSGGDDTWCHDIRELIQTDTLPRYLSHRAPCIYIHAKFANCSLVVYSWR